MNKSTFLSLSKEYSAIPVYRTLMADTLTPVSLFMKLRERSSYPFLLESVEGGERLARYSFLGRNPFQVLKFDGSTVTIQDLRTGEKRKSEASYYETLQDLIGLYSEPELPDLPRLKGGAVGYSSYDTIRQTENLPDVPEDNLQLPEAIWLFYDEIFAFDHVKHRIVLIKTIFPDQHEKPEHAYDTAQVALDEMAMVLRRTDSISGKVTLKGEVESNTPKEYFHQIVEKAKEYIYEGDIFQVVLSQRFSVGYEGDKFMLYRALRHVNPSPYLFYLDFDDFALVGSSPEVLVRVQNGTAEVLPIAGTRPRGVTTEEDKAYEEDLRHDPKELAEHVMLVDLGRNDLSIISKPGSVKVTDQYRIERYSHVMHIVSDVHGKLRSDKSSVDALRYCFPAGTVSGAPKVRAMEIIDECELQKRGPYAGAVGYFDWSGNMDTCIAIRTMVVDDEFIHIQAGAGIVADSISENEYQETVNKAKALVEALGVANKMMI